MSESKKEIGAAGQLFNTFFSKHWPVWVGGIVLGILNILLFTIKSPWGASGGINNWGENVFKLIGIFDLENAPALGGSLYGMLCLFLVIGSGELLNRYYRLHHES